MNKYKLLTGSLLFCFIVGVSANAFSQIAKDEKIDSTKLSSTQITPHLLEKINDKNIIYCSTFQMAWASLKKNIIKEEIKLLQPPTTATILNKQEFPENALEESSYVAMAGFGKDDIVKKINNELRMKFKNNAPVVNEKIGYYDIFAYSFLYKELYFNTAFERLINPIEFKSNNKKSYVSAFGINSFDSSTNNKLAEQVSIPYYKNDNEFILKLKTAKDDILLAELPKKETLSATLNYSQRLISQNKETYLTEGDSVKIPIIKFNIGHSYKEFIGKELLNTNFKPNKNIKYFIAKATQDTKFKLDEKGAILKSESKIEVKAGCALISRQIKNLTFNKPFLLYMKENKSSIPYLVIWVENPEILEKTKP
ncbi:MAG: hypothetical protein WCK67_11610 [bacterium]